MIIITVNSCKTRLYAGLLQLKIHHVHSTTLSHTHSHIHTNTDTNTRSVCKRINQAIKNLKKKTSDKSIHGRWWGSRVNLTLHSIHNKKGFLFIFLPSLIVFPHRTWHWIGRFPGFHNGGIMSWHWNITLFQRQLVEISNIWRSTITNFRGERKDLGATFVLYERRIGIRYPV